MAVVDPRAFPTPGSIDVPMAAGVHTAPSRISAPIGSLTDCRNFEVVDGAYEESQGLTLVGPALDEGLHGFWHADLPAGDTSIAGTWLVGDALYWYGEDGFDTSGSARIYYVDMSGSNRILTIDKVSGRLPRRANSFYTSSGATLEVLGASATGNVFEQARDLDLTWEEYEGPLFLGSLVASQAEKSTTWGAIKPDPLGVGAISGVFQANDHVYAARDFFGGLFVSGAEEPSIGDLISVDYAGAAGTFTARVACVELTGGSWEAGTAVGRVHLYPTSGTSLDMSVVDNWQGSTTISNVTTGNTMGVTVASGVANSSNKGLLWKKAATARQGGWSLVDMGYSLAFAKGVKAPVAQNKPLFVTDAVASSADTGSLNLSSPATEYPTSGTYSSWSGLSNLQAGSPGSYAATTIGTADYSRVIEANVRATANPIVQGVVKIIGLEVTLKAHQTVGNDVYIDKVQLRNDRTGAAKFLSTNKGGNQKLDTDTAATYTYGAQLDLWGFEEITQDELNDGNIKLLVQFRNANGASTRVVNVDQLSVKVHYAIKAQHVYFYNGASDVDSGTVHAYQVHDGDWASDNAQGWMTLYGLTSPSSVVAGVQIRSAANGGGELLATASEIRKNLLPSFVEMRAASAIYSCTVGSVSGDADNGSAYVATAASPAFAVDADDKFAFVRTPVVPSHDTPRYAHLHNGHLILAIDEHILVSAIGSPMNFNTYDGATAWSLKDRVTGLAAAGTGQTMIACQDSLHTFEGSGATGQDAFRVRLLTDKNGAQDYTIINYLGNVFVDNSGVSTAQASSEFGDLEMGHRATHLRNELVELLRQTAEEDAGGRKLVGAIPVRYKNQYRAYFSDGNILSVTWPDGEGNLAFTFQHYAAYYESASKGYDSLFVPTGISSYVMSTGEERIIIGTRLGHVMRVDPKYMEILSYASRDASGPLRKTTLQTWAPYKYIDLNPLHATDPAMALRFMSAEIYMQHLGYAELSRLAKTDYARLPRVPDVADIPGTVGTTTLIGSRDHYTEVPVDDYMTWFINELTDGLSIRFSKFGGHGSVPLRLYRAIIEVAPKATKKNRIHVDRAYPILDEAPALDLIVEANTASLVIHPSGALAGWWTWDSSSMTFDSNFISLDGWHV